MLKLFTDTDTDITPEIAQKYGYNLISMPYNYDGKTFFPYQDGENIDFHAFYDMLRGGVLPTTSAISEEVYREYFEPIFKNGDDILYVHFSAAMTMTFENMKKAVDKLLVLYPDRKFYSIDTKAITTLCLSIVIDVGQMYLDGKSAEEIVAWANEETNHLAMYFFVDDLKFFRRSGRVGGLAAMMGTLIGIRPIIYMSAEGKMESTGEKEKGRLRAMKKLISKVEELGEDVKLHRVLIGHSDAPEIAKDLENMLKERFGEDLETMIVPVNPTAGSHCGPDGVGIVFHAKHR